MSADTRKTVLITGCSSGIGAALTLEFAARGFHVLATARSASSLAELCSAYPQNITPLSLELTSPDSIAALVARVSDLTGGRLDYLVNNAGRNYTVPALELDFDEVQLTFETNVFSVMRMCKAFTPLLIEAAAGGTIVQVGSVAGYMPYVFGSVYNASKAALHAYSNTLRVELAPFGVKVVTVVTGGVLSNIARTERRLVAGSAYAAVEAEYAARVRHSQSVGMAASAYAASVARQVLRRPGSPPKLVWEGYGARTVWFIQRFFSITWMDHYFARLFNLWKLRKPTGTTTAAAAATKKVQ